LSWSESELEKSSRLRLSLIPWKQLGKTLTFNFYLIRTRASLEVMMIFLWFSMSTLCKHNRCCSHHTRNSSRKGRKVRNVIAIWWKYVFDYFFIKESLIGISKWQLCQMYSKNGRNFKVRKLIIWESLVIFNAYVCFSG